MEDEIRKNRGSLYEEPLSSEDSEAEAQPRFLPTPVLLSEESSQGPPTARKLQTLHLLKPRPGEGRSSTKPSTSRPAIPGSQLGADD